MAEGDFFAQELPRADVVTMGMILHDWNLARKLELIDRPTPRCPPGGAFVVIASLIDDERKENGAAIAYK